MLSHRAAVWILAAGLVLTVSSAALVVAQAKREVSVIGRRYTYVVSDATVPEIRVKLNDLVTITFSAQDIPHSFTIRDDHYRIDRRAEVGKPVTFSFRADKAGTFEIRCTLTTDERCAREMRGKLVVTGPDAGQSRR